MLKTPNDFLVACKILGDIRSIEGVYQLESVQRHDQLRVIASDGKGWDHVSVSLRDRCPTWEEMEYVRSLFFLPSETAMQLHVPKAEHINCCKFCLHMWRPQQREIPRPPGWMVAPTSLTCP